MSVLNMKKSQRLQRFSHYLFGFIVIVKGVEKAEHFDAHPFSCLALFLIGGFILFANFRHHAFKRLFKDINVVLFLCEGLVLIVVSYYLFSEGKKWLPYMYLLAAALYFVAAIARYRKELPSETIREKEIPAVPTETI
jgi:peptidoglycan/LPS O-acetylase OafA/YrhL